MTDIEAKVRHIIADETKIDPELIRPESTLDDLNIQSVDLVQIIFRIEETFDIYLSEAEIGFDVENVGAVYEAVKRLVAAKDADTP